VEPSGVAVVTGASRGIGRAVAIDLARAGFDVVATMRDPSAGTGLADEVGETAGSLTVQRLDVDDPTSIDLPLDLRVLVNNAGIERDYLPVEHVPMDQWRDVFETNVFGLVEVTRRAIPLLRAQGGGVICNITSSSILVPVPFYAVYRASKAAVSALDDTLRVELAPFGIRVVEIMPGPVESDMLYDSDRMSEAAEHEEYRAMAEAVYEGRKAIRGQHAAALDAAAAIRAAILDDDGPMRHGCEPMSFAMLDTWRTTSDEDLYRSMAGQS
jgi:NAD(P)-dependent dehydrogenase (short-subunit alcohol dehydrogenase family)